jgi:serine/threonine-protein kinase RsbW
MASCGDPLGSPVAWTPGAADVVSLSLPARAELLALARLTVATVASRAGFDVEEIEDLRLAIDELCTPLTPPDSAGGVLHLRFSFAPGVLEVRCRAEARTQPDRSAPFDRELSDRLLDALVDEHGRADSPDGESWLCKRREPGCGP